MPYPALPPEPPALVSAPESTEQLSLPACSPVDVHRPSSSSLPQTIEAPLCPTHSADQLQPLHTLSQQAPLANKPSTPFSITPSFTPLSPTTVSQQTPVLTSDSEKPLPDEQLSEPDAQSPEIEGPIELPAKSQSPTPDVLEVRADRQDYDTLKKVLLAVGNVLLQFREAELTADRIKATVQNRRVVAEGKVKLTRGNQILEGERLEYELEQNKGVLFKPKGTISFPTSNRDFSLDTPNTNTTGSTPLDPLSDPRQTNPVDVPSGGAVQTLRFEADRIEFTDGAWTATNIRISNDPFDPPELEVRADQARLIRISDTEDRVKLKRPRLVFDQKVSIPILRSGLRISRGRQDPFSAQIGYDDLERGGLFLGGRFTPFSSDKFSLTLTPQLFLERLIETDFDVADPDNYGITLNLTSRFSTTTYFDAFASINTVDVTNIADNLRFLLRLRQSIGNHQLSVESAYRERTFSGSLGEQEVLNRNGLILSSPNFRLGNSGFQLNYRLAAEYITAFSDRPNLAGSVGLGRFQGSATLRRVFSLWKGKTLPPTATEGLRYTPEPVLPNLRLVTSLSGTATGYTSSDFQGTLVGSVRVEGQFGHFSRPYLDYTSFNVGYAQVLRTGTSPFVFDRVVDDKVLSAGVLQHIYGPFRLGFQTSLNVANGDFFNTDIILDYSRRTYGITLRYNPEIAAVSLLFRVGGFNWVGNRGPLSTPEFGVVETGVQETNDAF